MNEFGYEPFKTLVSLKKGVVRTFIQRSGNRVEIVIPEDNRFPEASRKAVVEGELNEREGSFTIHSLRTKSWEQNHGYARILLEAIKQGMDVNEVIALSPSPESEDKGIYTKAGFDRQGRNRVWRR